jgi:hypothetical protein
MNKMAPEKPTLGEDGGIHPSPADRPGCPGQINPQLDEHGGIG